MYSGPPRGFTASVINIDPVVSGKHVSIRSSLQEHTRSASARRRSMPAQPTGSIIMNTAVRRMEQEGLCKSEWQRSEGAPARRMYSITESGEEYLAGWAQACKQYQNVMDCFYQAYTSR